MLPRKLRLTERYDYNSVRRFGKSVSCPLFILSFLKNSRDPKSLTRPSRIGLIVTNRVDKRATERHRIKRIFWEMIYENIGAFGLGYLVVFVARPFAKEKSHEEFSSIFNSILSKVSFT